MTISDIPGISAIYYALLQCGYGFYAAEREQTHIDAIRGFVASEAVPAFFSEVQQTTCEVYPYWPRAAMLETATFYLQPDHADFRDFHRFYAQIMAAGNIADDERSPTLWDWMAGFPAALRAVLASPAFRRYLDWESQWLAAQNEICQAELGQIQRCLDVCIRQYQSPVRDIQIVINPIKCVYSADYHLNGDCFVFSAGAFRAESVIHEFLHHVVHPAVIPLRERIAQAARVYPGLDSSYYLSGDDAGKWNAFEEYAVRALTCCVMDGVYPAALDAYLETL